MASLPESGLHGAGAPVIAAAVETPALPESTNDILSRRMPRVNSLTGLRWWAAFFVFTYHMGVFAPLPATASTFLHYGYFGVTFFFVLSGFVLTWSSTAGTSVSTFYWRRFARIYPSHVVALLFAIPVFYSFAPNPAEPWVKPVSVGVLLLSLLVLHGWFRDPTIFFSGNPAAWSLTYEAFFYAAFPLVARILTPTRKRGALIFAGAVVLVTFTYRLLITLIPGSPLPDLPWPMQHLTEFVLGMALAWAFRCGWRPRIPAPPALGVLVAVVVVIALAPRFASGTAIEFVLAGFSNEFVTVACAFAIVAVASHNLRADRSILSWWPLVRLGEWSFAFYLVHATFIYLALSIFGSQAASWRNLVWYLALLLVSVAAAAALHLVVEKPFERRMRAWKDRRDAARRLLP
jgi:peptidoglycan/LPS O-acetylase OafA/YrhL